MASGSRARGQGSAVAGADGHDLETIINPDLAHLSAVDLVAHLRREGRSVSNMVDVAFVVAVRELRLAEVEARLRAAEKEARFHAGKIRALELRVDNAEALLRDRTVAGEDKDDESQAGDHLAAGDIGAAELTGGEIRALDPEIVVPEVCEMTPGLCSEADVTAMPAEVWAGEMTPGLCSKAGVTAMPDEVGDNIPSPIPLMRIDASPVSVTAAPALPDEVMEERAVEEVVVDVAVPRSHEEVAEAGVVDCRDKVSEANARKRKKKPASDLSLPLDDDHRVTSHEVSEEEAHGEDVAASPYRRRSQGEQPARATKKKARKPETSFYVMVFKALKEKETLLKKQEAEAIAKKAAAAASKQLNCKCYWSNSGDGESSQK